MTWRDFVLCAFVGLGVGIPYGIGFVTLLDVLFK